MKELLTRIDFTLSIVGLNYKGDRRYKSPVGGFLSIIIFLTFVATITYHLYHFFKRTSPKYVLEDVKYFNPPEYDLSKKFIVAITTQYNGKTYFREDVLKIRATHYQRIGNDKTVLELEPIPCKREDFTDTEIIYDVLGLSNALCLNLSGLSIQGSAINNFYKYVNLKYTICEGDNCAPNIEEIIGNENPITYIYFLDTVFQINNSSHPTRNFINYVDLNISFGDSKMADIFFSKNELRIDDSYFFAAPPKRHTAYMIDSFRDMVSTRTANQKELLSVKLLSSKNSEVYKISFMQLSELLANISALINISVLIFTALGEYINNYFFINDLMSALYSLKNETPKMLSLKRELAETLNPEIKKTNLSNSPRAQNPQNLQNQQYPQKSIPPRVKLFNSFINNNNSAAELLGNTIQKTNTNVNNLLPKSLSCQHKLTNNSQTKFLNNKYYVDREFTIKEILSISFSQLLDPFRLCNRCGKLKRKYLMIRDKIFLSHDLINLYQKVQEIDMLKYLLLTEEQLALYRIIPKPVLILSKDQKQIERRDFSFSTFYNQKGFHYLKSNAELFEMFKTGKYEKDLLCEICNRNNKSLIDDKLLKIFQDRLFQN